MAFNGGGLIRGDGFWWGRPDKRGWLMMGGGLIRGDGFWWGRPYKRGITVIAKTNSSLTLNKFSLFHFNGIFIGCKGTVNV